MISLRDLGQGWNRFFFAEEKPLAIAVFRIVFGLVLLANQLLLLPHVPDWYGVRGVVSFDVAEKLPGGAGLNLFAWLPQHDATVWALYWGSCVLAVLLIIGLATRTSAALLFLTLVSLHHRNVLILNGGDTFLRLALFFLIFSGAGRAFSLDRLLRIARGRESGAPPLLAPWATRLIQLQLAFLYFYAFVWKATGGMWLAGTAVYYTSRLVEFWRFPLPYIFEHMWTIQLWSWATLLIEFALGTLVWIKELRYWVLLAGVLLHAGIDYAMNIPLFGFIMISAYVTFVPPGDLERFFERLRRGWLRLFGPREMLPLFYDGQCSFCLRSVELARRLDALRRIEFLNLHEEAVASRFPDLDRGRGESEMLARSRGVWLGGYWAFRAMSWRLPLLWLAVPFLYFPPVVWVGDRLYKTIARRRHCLLPKRTEPAPGTASESEGGVAGGNLPNEHPPGGPGDRVG